MSQAPRHGRDQAAHSPPAAQAVGGALLRLERPLVLETLRPFAAELARAVDLVSVIVYGDALFPQTFRPRDPVSLLVVARALDVGALERIAVVVAAWRRRWNLDPVLFTPTELTESLDVFPVELARARAAYAVVAGDDVLAGVTISPEHLRLQIEEDLRTKRLWLRQRILMLGGHPARDASAVESSFGTLAPILRAMLTWRERPSTATADGIINEAISAFALDADLVTTLRAVQTRQRRLRPDEAPALLARYMALLDSLVEIAQRG